MSARTTCPNCRSTVIESANHTLYSPDVDFFRCIKCHFLWHVPKGKDEPASQQLLVGSVKRGH